MDPLLRLRSGPMVEEEVNCGAVAVTHLLPISLQSNMKLDLSFYLE
jgi:hypothetical protein